jgi:YD repeat-containing protein
MMPPLQRPLVVALFFLILFTLLLPQKSHALVDMRNANFSENWTDLESKSAGYDLRIQRSYNSRTLYNGMFGFAWCTEFETSLKVTPENTLKVTDCGAGFEWDYTPEGFSNKSVQKNISSIMTEVRKRNRGRDESYFKNLEGQLKIDGDLREEFAKQLNMTGKVNKDMKYVTDGRSTDFITFNGIEYQRNLPNGTFQKFDKDGHLIQISDHNGNYLKVTYKGKLIVSVADNTGASLNFKYYDNSHFVKQVIGPKSVVSTYKYKGEDLTEVETAFGKPYRYEYDEMHNMTKASFADNSFIALTYDKDKDWVTSFRDRRGCVEKYTYNDSEKDPINNYTSLVEKKCNGKVTNKSEFEFWHKTTKDGKRYLAKSRSVINGKEVETSYHEEYGRPTEIVQDGVVTRLDYYPNGLLKTKATGNSSFNYDYSKTCGKVSKVVTKFIVQAPPTVAQQKANNDRKPSKVTPKTEARSIVTEFIYEPKRCNLIAAKNSVGQMAELGYDEKGRIRRITDQAKKEVNITYESQFGKPSVVSRPGLGTIKFKYKPDGTVDKFDSPDDPLVAYQVANIFSNLLELIAPATTDTNNI